MSEHMRSRWRRWSRRRKLAAGCSTALIVVGIVVVSIISVLLVEEWRSPSGKVFVDSPDGRIELASANTLTLTETLNGHLSHPPERVEIPRIGVRADVFMMVDEPPRFPAAGWLFGTAMPGMKGNLVLYGASQGEAAVFDGLELLKTGDEISVVAGDAIYIYHVDSIQEVDADQTDLLLPTSTPMVTLITDSGDRDHASGAFSRRLVVRGRYISTHAWSSQ